MDKMDAVPQALYAAVLVQAAKSGRQHAFLPFRQLEWQQLPCHSMQPLCLPVRDAQGAQ